MRVTTRDGGRTTNRLEREGPFQQRKPNAPPNKLCGRNALAVATTFCEKQGCGNYRFFFWGGGIFFLNSHPTFENDAFQRQKRLTMPKTGVPLQISK